MEKAAPLKIRVLDPRTANQIAAEQERRSRPTRVALIAVLGVIALALILVLQRFV